jgi:hypothetical protein
MRIGEEATVMGFVTQLKFLNGRTLLQIEGLLGFHGGRLAAGATIFALARLPNIEEFETQGYSQVAGHRHRPPAGLDPLALRKMAMRAWTLTGGDSLVNDAQYPPGRGVPQWKLTRLIPARVVAVLQQYNETFRLG